MGIEEKKVLKLVSTAFIAVLILISVGIGIYYMSIKKNVYVDKSTDHDRTVDSLTTINDQINGLDLGKDSDGFLEIDDQINKL